MNIHRAITHQTGFVLLEALIAILIFSIGILALVGMQTTAIKSVGDSNYRSTAGFLANEIIGAIWANRSVSVNADNVAINSPDMSFACSQCSGSNGNAITKAWFLNSVEPNLPAGATASIAITGYPAVSPVSSMVTVTLTWKPPSEAPTAASHVHAVSTFIN
jgi:type IV pilus assembly protein PilV